MKVPLRRVSVVHLSLSKVEAVADGGGQVCLEQAGGLVGVGEDGAEEPVVGVVGVGHEGALVSAGCRLPAIVVRRRLVCRVRGGRQGVHLPRCEGGGAPPALVMGAGAPG